jgi:hypothetical protein
MLRGRFSALLIVMAVSATGCGLVNPYACIYETRFIGTTGTASTADGTVILEYLNFRDYTPEAQSPTELIWSLRGQDFVAGVVSVTLRDERNPTQVVKPLVLFTQPTAGSFVATSSMEIPSAERDQIFNLLDGNAIVFADLANGSSVTVQLAVSEHQDWHRPSCD